MRSAFFLLSAAVLCSPSGAAAKGPVFERLVLASHEKVKQNHYSCLARLADDRVLAVWTSWEGHGVRRIIGSFSADHGRSWSEPRLLNRDRRSTDDDRTAGFDADPSILVSGPMVLVTWTRWPAGKGIRSSTTWCTRSGDNGRTWGPPYAIPMNHVYTCGKTHCGLRLRSGTLLMGYSWDVLCEQGKTLAREGDMYLRAGVMISTDDGRTWRNGGDTDATYEKVLDRAVRGTDEPALIELDDGSVFALLRTGSDHLYQARSTDEGRTWTQVGPSPLYGCNAPAALCHLVSGNRRGMLCVWNNALVRYPLSAAASFDGGRTWSRTKDISGPTEGRKACYPSCQQAADGTLVAIWRQELPDGWDIRGVRFSPDWLLDGAGP